MDEEQADGTGDVAMSVICREQYGVTALRRDYVQTSNGRLVVRDRSPRHTSLLQVFRTVFLPQGYPDSVSGDYAEYQVWDTVQAFASSVSNTLATHSLLHGMGVGDDSATVLAATLTWLLKDGTGMMGRIVFAWMKGTQLDCDAKRWRLFADFMNDFAICLEILAPLTQPYFRWVVCFAGVCKSLVGVAGGCTRAALTQHQARRNNMADVSAKDGSQETLVNLAALVCSFVALPLVGGHFHLTCALFVLLTALHLFANYRAVKSVRMESLNQARLHLIMEHYLRTGKPRGVAAINACEPVLWGIHRAWNIDLGASFSSVMSKLPDLNQIYNDVSTNYMLAVCREKQKLIILLSPQAQVVDQLLACVHAELVQFVLSGQPISSEVTKQMDVLLTVGEDDCSLLKRSFVATQNLFPMLMADLKGQGWRTDQCLLAADEWKVIWDANRLSSRKDV